MLYFIYYTRCGDAMDGHLTTARPAQLDTVRTASGDAAEGEGVESYVFSNSELERIFLTSIFSNSVELCSNFFLTLF